MSGLLPLFPLAALLAVLLAWPLARLVPPRRGIGGALVLLATFAYLYFSSSAAVVSLLGFVLAIVGLALLMGKRTYPSQSEARKPT